MRIVGFTLLIIGLLGVIINNLIIACVGTILGSIIAQVSLMYKYRYDLKCNK